MRCWPMLARFGKACLWHLSFLMQLRLLVRLPMLLGLAMASALAPANAAGIHLTDDRNVGVALSQPPRRIVSLLPSLTETVCALGACDRLVGVDRYSNYPASLQALPRTGGLDDANIELIVSLKPDVVLLALSSRVIDRLEGLGIKVVALEPRTLDDVQRVAGKVALLLGLPGSGEQLWQALNAQIADAARLVPQAAQGMRVYYEVDSAPYAAGEASFIGAVLARLGAVNIVPARLGPFPKLNPEFVVRANPQVIMIADRTAPGLASRPGWARIQALKAGRVCAFNAAQTDALSRPGPRMGEAAMIMAQCLQRVAVPIGPSAPSQAVQVRP
jgi:iron complex transport system substrate-binding protein